MTATLSPRRPAAPPTRLPDIGHATDLYERGRLDEAEDTLRRLTVSRTHQAAATVLLAVVLHAQGRTATAVDMLRPRAADDPLSAYNLAVMLLDRGETDAAERLLQDTMARFGGDADTWRQMARVHIRRRDFAALCRAYDEIRRSSPLQAFEQDNLARCLERLPHSDGTAQREADILAYLADADRMPEDIHRVVFSQLALRYPDGGGEQAQLMDTAAADRFLHTVLAAMPVTEPNAERLCQRLRRRLVSQVLTHGVLPASWLPLTLSLAAQNEANEYVHGVDANEQETVDQLEALCSAEWTQPTPDRASLAILLTMLALYRDPASPAWAAAWVAEPDEAWPTWMQALREAVRKTLSLEQRAASMPVIGRIDDALSQRVQAQYERNPYPRWRRCKRLPDASLQAYLERILPAAGQLPAALPEGGRWLAAGCGTGKEPIVLARSFPHSEILAIDLSARSLAYAQQKAEEAGLRNIRFAQADILSLDQWTERFDVILSSGVLHHMQDTQAAWQRLRGRLADGGVMHVALYSKMARHGVRLVRDAMARTGLTAALDSIRAIRRASLDGQLPGFATSVDFYSTSGCRDLLFHEHENSFEPRQVAEMLDALSLRLLGLDIVPDEWPDFARHFPTPASQLDLARWQAYEQVQPQVFGRMLSFWCVDGRTAAQG